MYKNIYNLFSDIVEFFSLERTTSTQYFNNRTYWFKSLNELVNIITSNKINSIVDLNNPASLLSIYNYYQNIVQGYNINKTNKFYEFINNNEQCLNFYKLNITNEQLSAVDQIFQEKINNVGVPIELTPYIKQIMEMGYNKSISQHFYRIFNNTDNFDNQEIIDYANITLQNIQNKSEICIKQQIDYIGRFDSDLPIPLFYLTNILSHCKKDFLELLIKSYHYDSRSKTITNPMLFTAKNNVAMKNKYLNHLFSSHYFNQLSYDTKCRHLKEVCYYNNKDKFCNANAIISNHIIEYHLQECFAQKEKEESYLNQLSTLMQSNSLAGLFISSLVALAARNLIPLVLKVYLLTLYGIVTFYDPELIPLFIEGVADNIKNHKDKIIDIIFSKIPNFITEATIINHLSKVFSNHEEFYKKDLYKAKLFIENIVFVTTAIAFGKYITNFIIYSGSTENQHPCYVNNKIEAELFISKHPVCSISTQSHIEDKILYSSFYDASTGKDSNLFCPTDFNYE